MREHDETQRFVELRGHIENCLGQIAVMQQQVNLALFKCELGSIAVADVSAVVAELRQAVDETRVEFEQECVDVRDSCDQALRGWSVGRRVSNEPNECSGGRERAAEDGGRRESLLIYRGQAGSQHGMFADAVEDPSVQGRGPTRVNDSEKVERDGGHLDWHVG